MYGGDFVTKNQKTTYEKGNSNYHGVSLHPNVDEVCYFKFVDWITRELGYVEVGQIWYKKHRCSLYSGRKQILADADIPEFLEAKESDGWYILYLVQPKKDYAAETCSTDESQRSESAVLCESKRGEESAMGGEVK